MREGSGSLKHLARAKSGLSLRVTVCSCLLPLHADTVVLRSGVGADYASWGQHLPDPIRQRAQVWPLQSIRVSVFPCWALWAVAVALH